MQKGVIYARYSSDRQNEQSIAGQVEVCTKWANDNDINIVSVYHDEALTGKNDKRPGFQRMVKDAKNGKFDYVIVYKLDRFARNRFDSAVYKANLKKYGVKVISAMEHIAPGPEGIILESVLEGMAEYYSANLAQNVMRGMRQKAEQGKYMGGTVPLGYKIDAEKNYQIDEKTAPAVILAFEKYAAGETIKEICIALNSAGYRTSTKKEFSYSSLHSVLSNRKYTGRYECMGVSMDNVIPKLIDDDVFENVQRKLQKNKRSPASSKGKVKYYLTGKLFCGKCGSNMVGDSGTGGSGNTHYYYSCIEKKRKHGCTKKSVKKDWIEQLITDITINNVLSDDNISFIAQMAFEEYEALRNDATELTALKQSLKEVQKTIDNIMNAIEQGIITDTTKQRMFDAEERKKELQLSIAKEEVKKPPITKDNMEFFLREMKSRIYDSSERIEAIVDTFVNAVYLYDDKLIITFNFKEGEDLKKIELSKLDELAECDSFGFDNRWFTITILSELFMFAVIVKLRSR
jgi:DNA invertase Pin-like site-specific DNA recombinase